MDSWHPARLCSGQRMTPHRWPATVSSTLQLAASASRSAASTSGLGCLARMVLTMYNTYEERSTTPRPRRMRLGGGRHGHDRRRHSPEPNGYLLGAPANLGCMAGVLKHLRPCLLPVPGGDRAATVTACTFTTLLGRSGRSRRSCRGLRWRRAGAGGCPWHPSGEELQACWELGAALAAGLTLPTG